MDPNDRPHPDAAPQRGIAIEAPDDPRVVDYREVRDKNLERRAIFLAESASVLRVLVLRRTHPLASVLVSETQANALASVLERVPSSVPIYVARQRVLDAIAGFHLHRGVLAAAHRTPVPDVESLVRGLGAGPATLVALEGMTNHDNVGGIFRNCAALGASGVVLDEASCDPLYRKAIRVSVGAALTVPYARAASSRASLEVLGRHGFSTLAMTPCPAARDLRELVSRANGDALPERLALVLGSEGPGLLPETLAACDVRVRIPQRQDFDSLNVATACGIALYALLASR